MTILLADDEERILNINKMYLTKKGYNVLTASDGLSAYNLIKENAYLIDICVLDVMMPEINGLELCSRIKKEEPQIKVIILTARGEGEDQLDAFNHDADDYMSKPYLMEVLCKRIERLCSDDVVSERKQGKLSFDKINMDLNSMTVEVNGQILNLSQGEYNILKCLLTTPGQVQSREVLIDRGMKGGTARSLEQTIYRLKTKLMEQGNHIETVRGIGYKLV